MSRIEKLGHVAGGFSTKTDFTIVEIPKFTLFKIYRNKVENQPMFTDILDYQYFNKTRRNISLNRLNIITVTKYNHNNVTVTIQNIAYMQTSMDQNDKS